ncbi:MAG: hypothetical protein LKF36_03270 [Lactobacillus sp.]|jgi:hypothetical protein|nr:hypothetical protein [Lactobacillus sp.]
MGVRTNSYIGLLKFGAFLIDDNEDIQLEDGTPITEIIDAMITFNRLSLQEQYPIHCDKTADETVWDDLIGFEPQLRTLINFPSAFTTLEAYGFLTTWHDNCRLSPCHAGAQRELLQKLTAKLALEHLDVALAEPVHLDQLKYFMALQNFNGFLVDHTDAFGEGTAPSSQYLRRAFLEADFDVPAISDPIFIKHDLSMIYVRATQDLAVPVFFNPDEPYANALTPEKIAARFSGPLQHVDVRGALYEHFEPKYIRDVAQPAFDMWLQYLRKAVLHQTWVSY